VAEKPDGVSALLFRGSGKEPEELKVSPMSKRTPGSYHRTHKSEGQFLLGSHPGSGQKPRGCTRVHARLVPDTHINMITEHDRQWLAIKLAKLDKLDRG